MKQNDISKQLGSLIGKTQGIYSTVDADESIPSELQEPDPIFEINYNDLQSVSNGEAYETVKYIVKSVVPEVYQMNEMIVNKMKLDAYQLGYLYYNQKINNTSIQTAMDVIAKGDTQPRMFDIIDKLQKRASDLTAQIIDMQNQFRKYYIDSYLDLKSKEDIDFGTASSPKKSLPKESAKNTGQIGRDVLSDGEDDGILSSSSEIIDNIQTRRLQRMKLKAKNAEFEEIEEES